MRKTILIASALTVLGAGPAFAQAAPAPAQTPASTPAAAANVTAGAQVVDATGAAVGTVAQVNGTTAIVDTGTNKVGVPVGNFAAGPNGLVLGNTKAELDAAAAQAAQASQAQTKALLVAGTDVHGVNGNVLGKVKSADGQFVTVTSASGGDVRLPVTGFAATSAGLTVGISQTDFDAAVAAAKPAAGAAAASAGTTAKPAKTTKGKSRK